jgi:hypothetical protein
MANTGRKRSKPRSKAPTDSFDEWASAKVNAFLWDNWPEDLVEEIDQVLKMNDSGSHRIAITDMIERMSTVHGISVGKDTMQKYVRKQLGRSSWSRK